MHRLKTWRSPRLPPCPDAVWCTTTLWTSDGSRSSTHGWKRKTKVTYFISIFPPTHSSFPRIHASLTSAHPTHPSIPHIHPSLTSIYASVHTTVLSVCLPIRLAVHHPVRLFVHLSIHPSLASLCGSVRTSIH